MWNLYLFGLTSHQVKLAFSGSKARDDEKNCVLLNKFCKNNYL